MSTVRGLRQFQGWRTCFPPWRPSCSCLLRPGARQVHSVQKRKKKQKRSLQPGNKAQGSDKAGEDSKWLSIEVDGIQSSFSTVLLRDIDEEPRSVDPSTKQKLFSTSDIPERNEAADVRYGDGGVTIDWEAGLENDQEHRTTFHSWETLRALKDTSSTNHATSTLRDLPAKVLWNAQAFSSTTRDIDYDAYMHDDHVLLKALEQLHTHGLLFLSNVPEAKETVSTIAERIGPIKNTFYGATWDVRSVPDAKNVAYTSQDLGFHMDLLYMEQPPHLQFLHCIRSSATGGANIFTDADKSARDLFTSSRHSFDYLASKSVDFHYNHPAAHLYRYSRRVFELKHVISRRKGISGTSALSDSVRSKGDRFERTFDKIFKAVSWSPPFQAPFRLGASSVRIDEDLQPPQAQTLAKERFDKLNQAVELWHKAAREFSALIHRPEVIHERLMKPGECVIFDNRRVLHARKAFEVADAGKERWLRGAYLDKDPYISKLNVLKHQLAGQTF